MGKYPKLEDKEWLQTEYIEKDRSQSDIANEIGCSQGAISNACRKFDLSKSQYKDQRLNDPEWLRHKHHNDNAGLEEIADIIGCTRSAVGYACRRNDIEIRQNTMVNELETPLSDEAKQIIEGELLGDGCIPKPRGKAGATFTYGTANKQYRDWLAAWFKEQGYTLNVYEYTQDADRDGWGENMSYRFDTHTFFSLMNIRKEWYPNGKKIVPDSFSLTPLSLRHWFIGDGSHPKDSDQIILYSDGFDNLSIANLIGELKEMSIWATTNHRNSILISRHDSKERFFEYMAPLPDELESAYGYKWP